MSDHPMTTRIKVDITKRKEKKRLKEEAKAQADAIVKAAVDESNAALCSQLQAAVVEASTVKKVDVDNLTDSMGAMSMSMSMDESESYQPQQLVEAVKAYLKKHEERPYITPGPRTIWPAEIILNLTDCKTDSDRINKLLAAIHPRKLPPIDKDACSILRTFKDDAFRLAAIYILKLFPRWRKVQPADVFAVFKRDEVRFSALQMSDPQVLLECPVKSILHAFETPAGKVQVLDYLNANRIKLESESVAAAAQANSAATKLKEAASTSGGFGFAQGYECRSAWFCSKCNLWASPEDKNRICAKCGGTCTESVAKRYTIPITAAATAAALPPLSPSSMMQVSSSAVGSPYAKKRVGKYCLNCNKRTPGDKTCDECHYQY